MKKLIIYPDGEADTASDLGESNIARLQSLGDFELYAKPPADNKEFSERIADADAIMLGWNLPVSVMEQATRLKFVSFTGIGAAKFVDIPAANAAGIAVSNCPGYGDNAVAEHTLALLFGLARKLVYHDHLCRDQGWAMKQTGMELAGKTIGVIGFGGIGQKFSALAQALGMRVLVWTRDPTNYRHRFSNTTFVDLQQLLREADIVSLHLAHSDDTTNFFDAEKFAQLKPGALFINTARGELVDEDAMVEALNSEQLGGAGIDVFCEEPLPRDHSLTAANNVLLSPHIAFDTPEATRNLHRIATDNIVSYFADEPVNLLTS